MSGRYLTCGHRRRHSSSAPSSVRRLLSRVLPSGGQQWLVLISSEAQSKNKDITQVTECKRTDEIPTDSAVMVSYAELLTNKNRHTLKTVPLLCWATYQFIALPAIIDTPMDNVNMIIAVFALRYWIAWILHKDKYDAGKSANCSTAKVAITIMNAW